MKWIKTIFSSDYGMLGVLVLLCAFFSWITFEDQQPEGGDAAEELYQAISKSFDQPGRVLIAGRKSDSGRAFTNQLNESLSGDGWQIMGIAQGGPPELGAALRGVFDQNGSLDLLACEKSFVQMAVLDNFKKSQPRMKEVKVMVPGV